MAFEKLYSLLRTGRTLLKNVRGSTVPINNTELNRIQNLAAKAKTPSCGLKLHAIESDVCQFNTDRSLSPEFLKSLLNTEGGTNAEKIINMKDKMLRAMGYKNPELLDIKINNAMDYPMAYNSETGKLIINEAYLNSPEMYSDLIEPIGTLRHEFDHLDKLLKAYKSVGAQKFVSALSQRAENLGTKMENINLDFYERMSRDVDITGFDAKYWLDALKDAKNFTIPENGTYFDTFLNAYLYAGNKLERSAYKIQSQVQQALGGSPITPYNVCYEEFGNVLKALEKSQITDKNKTFHQLYNAADIMRQTGDVSLVRASAQNFESLPIETRNRLYSVLDNHLPTFQEDKDMLITVQNWLNSGKYTIEDILPTLT